MIAVFNMCKKLIALKKTENLQTKLDVYYANSRLTDAEFTELCKMLQEDE